MNLCFLLIAALVFPNSTFAAEKEITAVVKGMVCAFCAQGITKKFKAESVVSYVDVSLEKKTVKLKIKEGQDLSDTKIENLLKDSGYNVEKISREGEGQAK